MKKMIKPSKQSGMVEGYSSKLRGLSVKPECITDCTSSSSLNSTYVWFYQQCASYGWYSNPNV